MVTGLDSSALWVLFSLGSARERPGRRSEEGETEVAHSFPVLPCWAVGWQRPQLLEGQATPQPKTIFFSGPCRRPQRCHQPQGTSSSLGIT